MNFYFVCVYFFVDINKIKLVLAFVRTSFVAMPMPHNISSLHQKECSPLTSSFTRKSKHVFADQDFFYMRSTDDGKTFYFLNMVHWDIDYFTSWG